MNTAITGFELPDGELERRTYRNWLNDYCHGAVDMGLVDFIALWPTLLTPDPKMKEVRNRIPDAWML